MRTLNSNMELKQNYEIDENFIGVFDNFFPEHMIDGYLNQFQNAQEQGFVYDRQAMFGTKKHEQDDLAMDLSEMKFYQEVKSFNLEGTGKFIVDTFFDSIYPLYSKKYSILDDIGKHGIFGLKIQKTVPGGGYHTWHPENSSKYTRDRVLAIMLYLNDVDEGGETEFLYQHCRIKPKRNRFLVWPAYFTHTHRGNPPLTNDKFIVTGWVEYIE